MRCAEWGAWICVPAGSGNADEWIPRYLDLGGDSRRLTLCSDAPRAQPRSILDRVFSLARTRGWPLGAVLPWATSNAAGMLRLRDRGVIERDRAADLVVLRKRSLEVTEVIAGGRRLVRGGEVVHDTGVE